jgi:acyl-[acyl-carrier-protein]-phospholipid O-acyltransferase/long-chain-fatty-acid--[acyl-carrier-protein] ligase
MKKAWNAHTAILLRIQSKLLLPWCHGGERITLLATEVVTKEELQKTLNDAKVNPPYHSAKVYSVKEIPKLGSGKIHFGATKQITLAHIE